MRTDFFLPADLLLLDVSPAQEQRRFEESKRDTSLPISEITAMALLLSIHGIVHIKVMRGL